MTLQTWKRKRGVALTTKGLQKLHEAKRKLEAKENFGNRYTLEEMSARSGLYPSTVSKVLNRERGVDRQTLEKLFEAFELKIDKNDYLSSNTHLDWGEAVCTSFFYGRTEELATLEKWIIDERCQLVALLGMGGIGKTSLSVKLAQQIQENFEYVIWRSLREAPPVSTIIANLLQVLSDGQETEGNLPETLNARISRLFNYLGNHRCLVILDNAESILRAGGRAGVYQQGYEGYSDLIRRVGEVSHQSCLVLTSRENPKDVAFLTGQAFPVRSLTLEGVKVEEGQEILKVKGLSAADEECKKLVTLYGGNPLALKIVSTTIQDVFDGHVTEFLQQNTAVFGDIREILDQQFERSPDLEKEIMYWLAINREPISLVDLQQDLVSQMLPQKLLDALESLLRRCLIDKAVSTPIGTSSVLFTLQPVVMEYVTQRLVEQVCQEIESENINLFRSHALIKATAKDYVRETQIRLILEPVIDGLLTLFRSKRASQNKLTQILARLREESPQEPSYTGGNIFNLLRHLETDLSGYDFSHLSVWQADLRNVNLYNANFAHANLAKSVFVETFGGIHAVAFSPDRQLLATGDSYGEVRLYQIADGKQLCVYVGHTDWLWSISFSPDGNLLASSGKDQTIKLWDVSTGHCMASLQGHSGGVWSVAFSPQGHILASGSEDHTVKLWDITTGQCFQTLQGHNSRVSSIAFSPDGQSLVSGCHDRIVRLWDISTGECLHVFEGHNGSIWSVTFSPDGQSLASGCYDRIVRLWDISTGECLQTFQGHTDCIYSVAFSSNGEMLASGSDDQTVRLWSISTGSCVATLWGHSSRVWSVAFNSDNLTVASGSSDQTVRLWDASTGQCLKTWQGYSSGIWSITFSLDGQILVSGSGNQVIKLWDVDTAQCIKTLQGHTHRVTSVALSPNSLLLASGSEDQTAKLWDFSTGQCLQTLRGHSNWITSVAISPDRQILASGSDDQTVRLWSVNTGQCIQILEGHADKVWSVAFNLNGQILASGSSDQTVKLWNVQAGQCIQTLKGHDDLVWSVTYSSDGRILASASSDQTIKLWDASTGQCIQTLRGHTSSVYSATFSPDDCLLASSSEDHTVKLWDLSTGQCLKTLAGHTQLIWCVAFSPKGQTLASCSQDDTIKIWDVKTGECLKTLRNNRPYEGVNIASVTGITEAQRASVKNLGAVTLEQ
jgi:WD40 repeat protein/transcriptional regulator with XRE-family HTH domain